jgi:hypothetical protein
VSALIDQAVFSQPQEPDVITATLWRGAMIDRFARAEFYILRCLLSLKEAGIALPAAVFSGLPSSRTTALDKALAARGHLVGSSAARKSLACVAELWELRNALAHGRIFASKAAVRICWSANDKAGLEERELTLSFDELLSKLVEVENLQKRLGSQLGQIVAALKKGEEH